MTDIIYKILNQDDTLDTLSTEKILFNDSIAETVGNAHILRVNHTKPKGITGNQALGQGTKDQQPEGLVGEFYTIEGVIPYMDGTLDAMGDGTQLNSTIERLKEWSDELDTLEDKIVHGQFGFKFNTVSSYTLTPISSGNNQIGLLWMDIEWKFNLILNIAEFTLKFKVDRGNDE